jgi:hypothetical protein
VLDEAEIAGMRKVCRLAREVLDIAARAAKPGVTTDYIDEIVHKACMEREVRYLTFWEREQFMLTVRSLILRPSTTATSPSQYAHRSTKSFATAFLISEFSKMATSSTLT